MKSCSLIPICFGLHYKIHYQATHLGEVFLDFGILIVTSYSVKRENLSKIKILRDIIVS